jgi:hypothetical protein
MPWRLVRILTNISNTLGSVSNSLELNTEHSEDREDREDKEDGEDMTGCVEITSTPTLFI